MLSYTYLIFTGVGISCYRLGELSEAEQALSEANILNNTDPEVWGYLSLVCLKTSRFVCYIPVWLHFLKNLVLESADFHIKGVVSRLNRSL